MLPEPVIQGVILAGAVAAWWFIPKREVKKRRWGFVILLCMQPFWIVTSWRHGQWAVLLISMVYVVNAIRGIRSHFWNGGGE